MTTPADPRKDQIGVRLRDLKRLREMIQLHGRGGELRIADLPAAERAEAEELLDRVGELDSRRDEERQELLHLIAASEADLAELASDPAAGPRARQILDDLRQMRSRLTGLPPGDEGGQP
jgi:hypothetical protein